MKLRALKFDAIGTLIKYASDEIVEIQKLVIEILKCQFKVTLDSEVHTYIEQFKQVIGNKQNDLQERIRALYGLLAMLSADQSIIYSWTELVMNLVLKYKNLGKNTENMVKEFFAQFVKGQQERELCKLQLTEETMTKVK